MADIIPVALSVRDVAKLLGIGLNSAYALVRCGALRSVRIGSLLRIPRSEVDRFLSGEGNDCA